MLYAKQGIFRHFFSYFSLDMPIIDMVKIYEKLPESLLDFLFIFYSDLPISEPFSPENRKIYANFKFYKNIKNEAGTYRPGFVFYIFTLTSPLESSSFVPSLYLTIR